MSTEPTNEINQEANDAGSANDSIFESLENDSIGTESPEQIVDYLSLTGDAVDNVPGVEKVGPKTAAKWIQQFGSLDQVMAHAGEIPGAVAPATMRS